MMRAHTGCHSSAVYNSCRDVTTRVVYYYAASQPAQPLQQRCTFCFCCARYRQLAFFLSLHTAVDVNTYTHALQYDTIYRETRSGACIYSESKSFELLIEKALQLYFNTIDWCQVQCIRKIIISYIIRQIPE